MNILKKNITVDISGIKYFAVYLVTFSIIVAAAYYYVGVVLIGLTLDKAEATDFNQIKDSTYFFNWLILYTKIDYWGKGFEETNTFSSMLTGISTYFYQPQKLDNVELGFNFKNYFLPQSILPNFIGTLFITTFSFLVVFIKDIARKYHYALYSTLLFLVIYTVFSCWWEPDYREFWVATMFSFWILSFLVFNYLLDRLHKIKPLPQIIIYTWFTLFAFLLFYFNFTGFIHPNAGTEFQAFEILRENTPQ